MCVYVHVFVYVLCVFYRLCEHGEGLGWDGACVNSFLFHFRFIPSLIVCVHMCILCISVCGTTCTQSHVYM